MHRHDKNRDETTNDSPRQAAIRLDLRQSARTGTTLAQELFRSKQQTSFKTKKSKVMNDMQLLSVVW
jgi:hypothetical protein